MKMFQSKLNEIENQTTLLEKVFPFAQINSCDG